MGERATNDTKDTFPPHSNQFISVGIFVGLNCLTEILMICHLFAHKSNKKMDLNTIDQAVNQQSSEFLNN